jgi:hypothetical protein
MNSANVKLGLVAQTQTCYIRGDHDPFEPGNGVTVPKEWELQSS